MRLQVTFRKSEFLLLNKVGFHPSLEVLDNLGTLFLAIFPVLVPQQRFVALRYRQPLSTFVFEDTEMSAFVFEDAENCKRV